MAALSANEPDRRSTPLSQILRAIRRRRGLRAADIARTMGLPLRSYEYFEAGTGRLDPRRVHQFAQAADAELAATYDELLADLRARRPDKLPEIDALATPENLRRMMHNTRVDVLAHGGEGPIGFLRLRGLGVARIQRPDKQFVLASHPIVKLSHKGRGHLLDPTCELWMALAPDIIEGLGTGPGSEKVVGVRDPAMIRDYNEACAGQSSVFASASPVLVRSLASAR